LLDATAFDISHEKDTYFSNLGNDSGLIMTDFENHYIVLLTNGTD